VKIRLCRQNGRMPWPKALPWTAVGLVGPEFLNEILDPSGSPHSILYVPLAPRVPNSALRRHALAAGQDALCLRSTRIIIRSPPSSDADPLTHIREWPFPCIMHFIIYSSAVKCLNSIYFSEHIFGYLNECRCLIHEDPRAIPLKNTKDSIIYGLENISQKISRANHDSLM
jgi:hypothetical protein